MNKQATLNKTLTIILTTTILLSIVAFNAPVEAQTTATTFVLSNEEGGLIDQLIADGHGNSNLYQILVSLAPSSNGVITETFLETLANCPAESEIFTATLNDTAPPSNNPIGINTDGTLIVVPIDGRDYYGQTGYSSYPITLVPGEENFIKADNSAYYIDAGSSNTGNGNYYVFAIAWMPNTVSSTGSPSPSGSVVPSSVSEGGLQVDIGWIVGAIISVVVILLVVWFLKSKRRKRHQ